MNKIGFLIIAITMFSWAESWAQISVNNGSTIDPADEAALMARNKQVGQFFKRFNGEEDEKGKRYEPDNRKYRDIKLRTNYLELAFEERRLPADDAVRKEFTEYVINKNNPKFLDIYAAAWYAEADVIFNTEKGKENFILILKREQENGGWKWVVTNVFNANYDALFPEANKTENKQFLHPLSHEIAFMNFKKAFDKNNQVTDYAQNSFFIDKTALFFYDIKTEKIKFEMVNQVVFHFLQIDNWYFKLENIEKPGLNAGWLISSVSKITNDEKKAYLHAFEPISNK